MFSINKNVMYFEAYHCEEDWKFSLLLNIFHVCFSLFFGCATTGTFGCAKIGFWCASTGAKYMENGMVCYVWLNA